VFKGPTLPSRWLESLIELIHLNSRLKLYLHTTNVLNKRSHQKIHGSMERRFCFPVVFLAGMVNTHTFDVSLGSDSPVQSSPTLYPSRCLSRTTLADVCSIVSDLSQRCIDNIDSISRDLVDVVNGLMHSGSRCLITSSSTLRLDRAHLSRKCDKAGIATPKTEILYLSIRGHGT